jgi:formamidopyrimidine-DNA glycosylase
VARVVHLRRDIIKHGPPQVPRWLNGSRIVAVTRRGKRPVICCAGDRGLVIFLGMSGYVDVHPARATPRPHTHLRLALDDGAHELRFADARRFGGVSFYQDCDLTGTDRNGVPSALADLGVEPLAVTRAAFRRVTRRHRQIKALLMDQGHVAGLGNIYCDEALHRARIHPRSVADELDDAHRDALRRAIRQVLRAAIRHEGTTIINYQHPDGPGNFTRRLRVYGRTGEPCKMCKTPIVREVIAGRSTHYCPACQPAP